VYKRDNAFRMNVMEEIFEIRSCIEILANDIKVDSTDQYNAVQLTENYKVYENMQSSCVPGVLELKNLTDC